jgi:hypothetical protein
MTCRRWLAIESLLDRQTLRMKRMVDYGGPTLRHITGNELTDYS